MHFLTICIVVLIFSSDEMSHGQIIIKKSHQCGVDAKIFDFLTQFIRQEFLTTNINIIYNSTTKGSIASEPLSDFCENIRENFHRDLYETNQITATVTFFQPDMKNKPIGYHIHQHTSWSELNLILLFDGSVASDLTAELIKLRHFQRANSFNIFWQRENRKENFLERAASLQKLKYKIELYTNLYGDDNGVIQQLNGDYSTLELEIKSVCFYCDFGYPEMQIVWLHLDVTKSKQRKIDIPSKGDIFKDYTKNMHGKILQVSLSKGMPTMMSYKILKSKRIETNGGFQIRLFHLIRRKLNFSYNITVESTFGLEGNDGIFSGTIGAIQTGRSELGIGATVTHKRAKVVHYLTPNTFHLVTFITGNPKMRPEWQFIFRAFTLPTWITVFLTAILLVYPTFILGNVCIFSEGKEISIQSRLRTKIYSVLGKGVEFTFQPVCEQRWSKKDKTFKYNSIRMMAIFWLIGIFIINTELKCNLMKMAISPPMEKLPSTFAELADSDYEIYTHYSGGSLDRIIRTTHSQTFDKITQKMKTETSINKCLSETVHRFHAACILYEDDGIIEGQKYFTDPHGRLLIHRAPSTAGTFNFFASVIVPKEAIYIESMESTVNHIVDMGLAKKFHDDQYEKTRIKGQRLAKKKHTPVLEFDIDSGHHYEKLTTKHLLIPLVILAFGSIAAIVVFIAENKYFKHYHLKRHRNRIFIVKSQTGRKQD